MNNPAYMPKACSQTTAASILFIFVFLGSLCSGQEMLKSFGPAVRPKTLNADAVIPSIPEGRGVSRHVMLPKRILQDAWRSYPLYGGGIAMSSDAGEHWQVMGLTGENFVDAIAVNPANSNVVLAGAGFWTGNLYKSTDRGVSWQKKLSDISFVYDLAFDPRDTRTVFAATEGSGVLRSLDGGETWEPLGSGMFYPLTYSLALGGKDTTILLAGSYGSGVYWMHPSPNTTGLEDPDPVRVVPGTITLAQNYPNPFNPATTIEFTVGGVEGRGSANVTLAVFDLLGREMATLVSGRLAPGEYTRRWDATGVPSGVYFYRLEAGGYSATRRLVVIK